MVPTPKFGKSPLELLEPNVDYDPTFFEAYGATIIGPIVGLAASVSINFGHSRPLLKAGVPRHILFAAIGLFAFRTYKEYKANYNAERDAVYRHYIQLHPEDFPPPDRKQYKDVFLKWVPIR